MTACKLMVAILLTLCTQAIAQTSFWTPSATPSLPVVSSTASVTLGLKFYSDVPGSVTGIRFYKGAAIPEHIGSSMVKHGNEAGVGHLRHRNSFRLAAGDLFLSRQHCGKHDICDFLYCPKWRACARSILFLGNLNASVLHVAGSTPGVYTYGSGALFPTSAYNNSNYWVDVVFSPPPRAHR